MFTLIKRECYDMRIYFLLSLILSAGFVALTFGYFNSLENMNRRGDMVPVIFSFSLVLFVVSLVMVCGLGVSQMYVDRNRKVSSLLVTLPVTRKHILSARVITGLMVLAILVLPVAITSIILTSLRMPPLPFVQIMPVEIFTAIFLLTFCIYLLGLYAGWNANRVAPTLSTIVLSFLLAWIIVIKGFGVEIVLILLLLSLAMLVRIWNRYMLSSL